MLINILKSLGSFFRIVDENGVLSLTNIAVYITLYKLLTSPITSYTDVGALLAALGTYTVKKVIT